RTSAPSWSPSRPRPRPRSPKPPDPCRSAAGWSVGLDGPLLVGGAGAVPDDDGVAGVGAAVGDVQAAARLRVLHGAVASQGPLLGGGAVAAVDLDRGAVAG